MAVSTQNRFGITLSRFSRFGAALTQPMSSCSSPAAWPVVGHSLPLIAPEDRSTEVSYGERSNLTLRMSCRRFTRLTNAFIKKVENHAHAIALHFMYYNFWRIHKMLRVTPAMEAGLTDHVWSLEEIAELVPEPVAKKRGPYKKTANVI